MKALVIYDSLYGNTEKIAHAIGDGLSGAIRASGSVDVLKVGDAHPDELAGLDLLLVGAPTQRARPSPAARDSLNRIPKGTLAGVKVAAFDTRGDMEKMGTPHLIARFLGSFFAHHAFCPRLRRRVGRGSSLQRASLLMAQDQNAPRAAQSEGRGLSRLV